MKDLSKCLNDKERNEGGDFFFKKITISKTITIYFFTKF